MRGRIMDGWMDGERSTHCFNKRTSSLPLNRE